MKFFALLSALSATAIASSECMGYIATYPQTGAAQQSINGAEAHLVLADTLGLSSGLNGNQLAEKEQFFFALPQMGLGPVDSHTVLFSDHANDDSGALYAIESAIDMGAIQKLSHRLEQKHGAAKASLIMSSSSSHIEELISNADEKNPVTVVYAPSCLRATNKEKRGGLPASKKKQAIGIARFGSEDECNEKTNNCSGHGACSKGRGESAYTCKCKTGRGGKLCQKQDVSVQFQLFFWTAVVALITITLGIKLMMSVGSEPLPGVLGK
ncbi:hypothetical protein B0I72DRAFT_149944 [Yarrowia lipolytica]|uniref:YALI0E15202p n=2 Tax=Yarrowia lipolytica TaxID=4952 RepID=Q6C5U0_YARLI|nr:YALI0E15202p [Yarrowia lipolytica CLIB122]RDW28696.1 hypothetical protein B0I71DRAFT_126862 [Yarrowia lipolytica]RDW35844.1 hypothetical protein B0I72DRAFT_149944 [Yarrowia lipolytica]RDW41678.1 hypothetical protein B0I73DRAFT_114168 [Yarrowia lipolytica]RDW47048.1 hypothetical protein B0I74DRAFT_22334 [Yarrowia lipolytica]RDW54476.1 hypothetical protein B0I75DRAFT_100247 [Yarrowia lipolytica]|eukprot:XP_503972.1 YALI0E15202p [Yarrowia lipolytica CLIB122]